jgi:outer membrane protein assembly factor BamB
MRPMFFKSLATLIFVVSATLASSALAAAPTITSFTPGGGKLSSSVTISGTGFVAPVTVTFNGVASTSVTVNSPTSLTALVPLTAGTGNVAVTDSGGSVTSANPFNVFPGDITSFANTEPGTAGVIYFSGFNAFEAVDLYFDTTDFGIGSSSNAGAGNAAATIPTTATPGTHWITAVGRHSGYSAQFSYLVRTDWMELGFRPNHRGRNPFENVLSTANVNQLDESWRFSTSNGAVGGPADVAGIVYQGFNDGTVRAINESTGTQTWVYTTGNTISSSALAVVNGAVYVGSADWCLYALNATTGALKWRYQTGSVIDSAPVVKGGIVYFGSNDGSMYALNVTTGALVWKYATGNAVESAPAVWNGMVFFGSNDDKVYALNAATGALIWSYTTGGPVLVSPAVVGGTLYIGSDDAYMYAFEAQFGVLRWQYLTGNDIESSAAFENGTVYFGSDDQKVYALDGATGELKWSFTDPYGDPIEQKACVANGVVYIGDSSNTFALDASSGALDMALPAGNFQAGSIAVNGALLVTDNDSGSLVRYTLTAAASEPPSAAPDPGTLRHHPLR